MSKYLVSVAIPTYNRPQMLKESLESFIHQEGDFEIIVGSDGGVDIKNIVVDKRIRYYKHKHRGIAAACNLVRRYSTSKYIMPFADDDISLPGHVKILSDYLDTHDNIDAVYGDYEIFDGETVKYAKTPDPLTIKEDYERMKNFQVYPHGGTMWRRNKYPRLDETLESAVDWELMFNCLENGVRFARVPVKLWKFRTGHKHEEGTERQHEGCKIILARRGVEYRRHGKYDKTFCNTFSI